MKTVLYQIENRTHYAKEMVKTNAMIVVFMKIMRCIILHMTIDSVKKFKDSGFAVLFLILKYLPYFLL